MAKSSNVMARVEPEIKEQAESILSQLGLPVSVLINSLYRQIIMAGRSAVFHDGAFSCHLPRCHERCGL